VLNLLVLRCSWQVYTFFHLQFEEGFKSHYKDDIPVIQYRDMLSKFMNTLRNKTILELNSNFSKLNQSVVQFTLLMPTLTQGFSLFRLEHN